MAISISLFPSRPTASYNNQGTCITSSGTYTPMLKWTRALGKLNCMQPRPCVLRCYFQHQTHIAQLAVEQRYHRATALHDDKLKEVGRLLVNTMKESAVDCLIIIDSLQHLAIDYHFQEEIQSVLSNHYTSLIDAGDVLAGLNGDNSLFSVSLCFRLLRQNGYHATTDVFNRFLDEHGKFEEQLSNDINALMSLYQASQFGIGEKLLDQANLFTSNKLRSILPQLNEDHASVVKYTLEQPYDKNLTRFKVKNYIKCNHVEQRTYGILLREFAKMDFNIVQSQLQRELLQVSLWWRELGLTQTLTFTRDQPVKWYMWSMATLADPMLSDERIDLTKSISLIYVLDDIFDVYGTLDQLVLLTEAINKWEIDLDEQLPCPMKIFLMTLYRITDEISSNILNKYGWNPIESLRKAWARLCNAFLVEAKWFASGHLPSSEEYLMNGVISTGVHVIFVHVFFLLGQGINQESVDLMDNDISAGLVSYTATILRLWDDLGSAKDEKQQGYDGSYIRCYMNENKNSTIEGAREHVNHMISDTWTKLNKEYLSQNRFSLSLKKASLDATRMVRFMYSYDSNQRLPILEKHIKSVLYQSIPLQ